jgi:hypothetical protein
MPSAAAHCCTPASDESVLPLVRRVQRTGLYPFPGIVETPKMSEYEILWALLSEYEILWEPPSSSPFPDPRGILQNLNFQNLFELENLEVWNLLSQLPHFLIIQYSKSTLGKSLSAHTSTHFVDPISDPDCVQSPTL